MGRRSREKKDVRICCRRDIRGHAVSPVEGKKNLFSLKKRGVTAHLDRCHHMGRGGRKGKQEKVTASSQGPKKRGPLSSVRERTVYYLSGEGKRRKGCPAPKRRRGMVILLCPSVGGRGDPLFAVVIHTGRERMGNMAKKTVCGPISSKEG